MEPLVTIAISDLSGIMARNITLQAIGRHTSETYEIVLLLEESQSASVSPKQNSQVAHRITLPAPLHIPAALNRLLTICTTPYLLLLESGAIVTAGWLGRLLAAFNDPTVGLCGPSTNSSWNEQKVLERSEGTGWSVKQIDAFAADVAKRYSHQWHSLDTLHSLGDFCYLFKRSVAEQLGGFDEAYGAGPCWEIDFNTRAARAGFRAIWVADAYVHRSPPSPWKVNSVHRHFTASRQLYQDRFCGLRLQGKKTDYEPHCRGEACVHFAPPDLIQVTLQQMPKSQPAEESCANKKTIDNALSSQTANTSINGLPLVSCIMPTRNRRAFMRQSLAYFERQDYPNKELIIVDDGDDKIEDLVSSHPNVRYIALPQHASIGAKRNIACEQARGDIIAHWDDDDWYASHRLSHQVVPLLDKKADMTGLETSCFFDLTQWQAWTCTPDLHRRLFVGDVHGGTLVYWHWVWEHFAHYPALSIAEDAAFLKQACLRGARLHKLPHDNSFVYLRHDNNAWRFPLGSYLQSAGWQHADLSAFLPPADLPFYATLSPTAPALTSSSPCIARENEPLVSCIMPTYNRRAFVVQAIAYFLRQEYSNKELIIVDDGTDAICDLVPADERIRYIRLPEKTTIGAKRNPACEQARGTIIAHWDDDDWQALHRLRYQVEALLLAGTDLCGISAPLFYEMESGRTWQYVYPAEQRGWLSGSTLCYTRTFWASNRFADINVGEDARFVWGSRREHMTVLEDATFHVGMIHKLNVSPKKTNSPYWHLYPLEEIQHLLEADWTFCHSCLKAPC